MPMPRFSRAWLLPVGLALVLAAGAARAAEFARLYNGKDLSGWHVESGKLEAWKANGEMISCLNKGGGYLATDREYGDFELRMEYRMSAAGNSGVGIRFPRGGWPSTQGMEIQLLDDDAPRYANLDGLHRNGAIYTHVAPRAKAQKPAGEWNRLVIRCQGPRIAIHLNGVEIQNVNVEEYANSLGKGKTTLAQRPRRGLIGIQSHDPVVDFRNLEIREL